MIGSAGYAIRCLVDEVAGQVLRPSKLPLLPQTFLYEYLVKNDARSMDLNLLKKIGSLGNSVELHVVK